MRPSRSAPDALRIARIACPALAALGALLLLAATFATVVRVRAGDGPQAVLDHTGWDRHGPALALLALVAVPLAAGAWQGARPAAIGLTLTGVGALLLVVVGDLGDLHDPGAASDVYADARAGAGPGWFLETAAAVCLLAAGGVAAMLPDARRVREARPPRRSPARVAGAPRPGRRADVLNPPRRAPGGSARAPVRPPATRRRPR